MGEKALREVMRLTPSHVNWGGPSVKQMYRDLQVFITFTDTKSI